MVPSLIDFQLDAKASSTVIKYKSGWLRWSEGHDRFWSLRSFNLVSMIFVFSIITQVLIEILALSLAENGVIFHII